MLDENWATMFFAVQNIVPGYDVVVTWLCYYVTTILDTGNYATIEDRANG